MRCPSSADSFAPGAVKASLSNGSNSASLGGCVACPFPGPLSSGLRGGSVSANERTNVGVGALFVRSQRSQGMGAGLHRPVRSFVRRGEGEVKVVMRQAGEDNSTSFGIIAVSRKVQ
jgi:hypothetical protein